MRTKERLTDSEQTNEQYSYTMSNLLLSPFLNPANTCRFAIIALRSPVTPGTRFAI